ncbi:hypothetical protein ACLOJK_000867 [Asimina triloba]
MTFLVSASFVVGLKDSRGPDLGRSCTTYRLPNRGLKEYGISTEFELISADNDYQLLQGRKNVKVMEGLLDLVKN